MRGQRTHSAAHLAEAYGASVSKQIISTSTDKVIDGMAEWQNRPLDPASTYRWLRTVPIT